MAEPDRDRDSIDRAFADLVAGYHLTAERPDEPYRTLELTGDHTAIEERGEGTEAPDAAVPPARPESPVRADSPVRPETPVRPLAWRPGPAEAPLPDERYVPDPLPPLSRPGAPALVGWTAVLFAAVVVLAAGFGLDLPSWLGWVAVSCFIAGTVVLLTQLPRHRPPEAGDGAVL